MGKKPSGSKQAFFILGALALGWLAIEIAFKPFLDKARSAMDNSDPTRDPDDLLDKQSDHLQSDDDRSTNA
ncbi:outer envelope membrane protein 7-like [Cucurbita maxima]|uniref:Outer envelope membrane protein 7-like n=1 Tax=Cucurbita maxima TaxID=3661 RepID=A0A6J1HUQ5_CUCMA|nr:outer envelope membrane protein 7-like [Cucurbita maxima]XP_022967521.1 outer envelope membrane protein 7-like [Cucurbita maxima]